MLVYFISTSLLYFLFFKKRCVFSVLLLHGMILISKISCISMLQMILLEGAKATTETVDALRTGAAAMKAMQKATYVVLSGLLNSFVILYFPEYKYKLACF